MQQFIVPQFLDVEDKIIGPITTRQFVIVLGGAFLLFIEYKTLDFAAFLLFGLLTAAISAIFAFMKVNGMPFHFFLFNVIATVKQPKLRVWQRVVHDYELRKAIAVPKEKPEAIDRPGKELLTKSHLQQLSLTVDTGGSYKSEEELERAKRNAGANQGKHRQGQAAEN